MRIIVDFPEDENPKFVEYVAMVISDSYASDKVKVTMEQRWCSCKEATFDSYINAKCKKCGGEID